jgi:hypothetical protein
LAGANNHSAIRTIVNGQYVNPSAALKMLDGVPNANALAVAPYFLFKLDKSDDPLAALFNQDDFLTEEIHETQSRGKELLIYEVNLHTTGGDAGPDLRDIATTGSAAGTALAKRLMMALNLGVKKQCIYQLSQYDAFIDQSQVNRGLVKLWGVVRDLGETQRVRPTGLAMSMLNQALPADIHLVKSPDASNGKDLTLTVFHNPTGWALAVASSNAEQQKITVHFPAGQQKLVWRVLRLDSPSTTASNENSQNVRITEEEMRPQKDNISINLTVPPYGFVVALAGK